jgi:hypothetical protein
MNYGTCYVCGKNATYLVTYGCVNLHMSQSKRCGKCFINLHADLRTVECWCEQPRLGYAKYVGPGEYHDLVREGFIGAKELIS